MSERREQIDVCLKILVLAVLASLYSWGGMELRQLLRRTLAPIIAGISISYFSRDWKGMFHALGYYVAGSLGYGASDLWMKIFKRGYTGLAYGLAGSILFIKDKRWLLVGYSIVLCMATMITFGVWNPFNSARIEEAVVGLMVYAIPILSARKR